MYGVIAGDLIGFPYEYKNIDLNDREIPLFSGQNGLQPAEAGRDYSDRTVLTAAMEEGLVEFEKKLPGILAGQKQKEKDPAAGEGTPGAEKGQSSFEKLYAETLTAALRRYGRNRPLAGYSMDFSIWMHREDAPLAGGEDAGPAARAVPVAWMFQEDLYMMRHLARGQAKCTHRGPETIKAADAAACAVFLAIHGQTKEYIAQYLEREFGYRTVDEAGMRQELLQAGAGRTGGSAGVSADSSPAPGLPGGSGPALCVRAAMTAFLHGRDFEDVLRRAVSLGGRSSEIAPIAGGIAEAFFGMPDEIREKTRALLPEDLRAAADAFAGRMQEKKNLRAGNPRAQARWEQAITRASARHPAAVQGNEPLEETIRVFRQKKDQQSFVNVLELVRLRMNQGGRVFVPLAAARRAEPEEISAGSGAGKAVAFRMQAIRTRDGKLWQPAYTGREELNLANDVQSKKEDGPAVTGLVLSYSLAALLRRFLPAEEMESSDASDPGTDPDAEEMQNADHMVGIDGEKNGKVPEGLPAHSAAAGPVPAEIVGIVLNPYGDRAMFLPRQVIRTLFVVNRETGRPTHR